MAYETVKGAEQAAAVPAGWQGLADDWSADRQVFKNVPWGKAMM